MNRITAKDATLTNIVLRKEDCMTYLSRSQAEQWLNQHTLYGKKRKMFTNKFMKMLKKTYRLVPDKTTLFGKKYSLLELKEYAHDVNPRDFA